MSGAATPQLFSYERVSEQNGAITEYTFHVKTTNYIIEGDSLLYTLPFPAYFSEDSKCFGVSTNLVTIQPCTISTDLATATVQIDILGQRLLWEEDDDEYDYGYSYAEENPFMPNRNHERRKLQKIDSGQTFSIKITDVTNPLSFRPTEESIEYKVIASDGFEVEFVEEGYHIVNTVPGYLDIKTNSILPTIFERGLYSNYTLYLAPTNFLQNMTVVVTLPE